MSVKEPGERKMVICASVQLAGACVFGTEGHIFRVKSSASRE